MNKGQEILEAADERGEIGLIDQTAKPADAEAAGESLLAVQLGNGETIFVEASRLTNTADNKFQYASSFQNVERRGCQTGRYSHRQKRTGGQKLYDLRRLELERLYDRHGHRGFD